MGSVPRLLLAALCIAASILSQSEAKPESLTQKTESALRKFAMGKFCSIQAPQSDGLKVYFRDGLAIQGKDLVRLFNYLDSKEGGLQVTNIDMGLPGEAPGLWRPKSFQVNEPANPSTKLPPLSQQLELIATPLADLRASIEGIDVQGLELRPTQALLSFRRTSGDSALATKMANRFAVIEGLKDCVWFVSSNADGNFRVAVLTFSELAALEEPSSSASTVGLKIIESIQAFEIHETLKLSGMADSEERFDVRITMSKPRTLGELLLVMQGVEHCHEGLTITGAELSTDTLGNDEWAIKSLALERTGKRQAAPVSCVTDLTQTIRSLNKLGKAHDGIELEGLNAADSKIEFSIKSKHESTEWIGELNRSLSKLDNVASQSSTAIEVTPEGSSLSGVSLHFKRTNRELLERFAKFVKGSGCTVLSATSSASVLSVEVRCKRSLTPLALQGLFRQTEAMSAKSMQITNTEVQIDGVIISVAYLLQ